MVNVLGCQVAEGIHIWTFDYGNYVIGIGNHTPPTLSHPSPAEEQ